jgi:hypothetical protein
MSDASVRLDEVPIKDTLLQFSYVNWLRDAREQEYAKLRFGNRITISVCTNNSQEGKCRR